MIKEIWKDIPSYNEFYKISNYGNVKSLRRIILDKIEIKTNNEKKWKIKH